MKFIFRQTKPNKKVRRHSGRETTKLYHPGEEPFEETHWNDWNDWRDGMRFADDKTQIRSRWCWFSQSLNVLKFNKKNKKLLLRRKAMKDANKNKHSR